MTTESVEQEQKTYRELVEEVRKASRELGEVKDEAEREAYNVYRKAAEAAEDVRREARKPLDEAYNEAVNEASKILNAANEAANTAFKEERTKIAEELAAGSNLKNAKLATWMLNRGIWGDYRTYCETVLEFLDRKERTLEDVYKFGTREQRWCGVFQSYLLQAIEEDAVPFEASSDEAMKIRFEMSLVNLGLGSEAAGRLLTVFGELGIDGKGSEMIVKALAGN